MIEEQGLPGSVLSHPKSCTLSKSSVEKDNSENNKDSGSKSKIDFSEVDYLKSAAFNRISQEDAFKQDILKFAAERGFGLSEFYDLLFRAVRNHCSFNIFGETGTCMDDRGEELAFSRDAISKAFNLERPTCLSICKLGCCAAQNQIAYSLLCQLVEEKQENQDERK